MTPQFAFAASGDGHTPDVWWGYSGLHGWVALDRAWPGNEPGLQGPLTFVRCSDWSLVIDDFRTWREGKQYHFSPNYFVRLEPVARRASEEQLKNYRLEYESRREELFRALLQLRLEQWSSRTGRDSTEVHWADSRTYREPCWNCTKRLNSTFELKCRLCGYYACYECGRCMCSRPRIPKAPSFSSK